jgi:hypothetical protein
MNTAAHHYLTITDPRGKQMRGLVVHLQPQAAQGRSQRAVVHVVTRDWLPPSSCEAIYRTPTVSLAGRYTPHGYGDAAGQWLLMGTFEVTPGTPPLA